MAALIKGVTKSMEGPRLINCNPAQGSGLDLPSLQRRAEFTWPVFLCARHEHLSAAFAGVLQQGNKSGAAVRVEFAHHVVNEQDRRRAMNAREVFGLRDFQRDGKRPLLAFAAKLRGRAVV